MAPKSKTIDGVNKCWHFSSTNSEIMAVIMSLLTKPHRQH